MDEVIAYGNMTTVISMHHVDNGRNFVRITGDCMGSSCDGFKGYFDIELKDELTLDDISHMMKAIIHLAELHGAKVNQKEPF